jgi:hypothetical protein
MLNARSDVAGCFPSQQTRCSREVPGLVGMEETLDIQALWRAGKSVSEIARGNGPQSAHVSKIDSSESTLAAGAATHEFETGSLS